MATIGSLTADLRLESAAFIRDLGKAANEVSRNTGIMRRQFAAVQKATESASRTLKGLFTVTLARQAIRQLNRLTRESLDAAAAIQGPLGDAVREFQAQNEQMTKAFEVGFGVAYVEAFNAALKASGASLEDIVRTGIWLGSVVGNIFGNLIALSNQLYLGWTRFKDIVTFSAPATFSEANPLTFGEYSMGDAALVDQITAALNNMTPALQSNQAAVSNWKTTVSKDMTDATASAQMFSDQWIGSLQSTLGGISSFSGALADEQEEWFRVNQAVSIAQALIATYTGAAEALKLGPIIGPALAALQVATGLAYVAQIAAQKPGGGVSGAITKTGSKGSRRASEASSGGGGGRSAGQAVNVTLVGGPSYSREQVRDLAKALGEYSKDGGMKISVN